MARREKMDDEKLAALVDGWITSGLDNDSSSLSGRRETAQKYFNGDPNIVPTTTGRSAVVSRDVADVHGMIMPSIMRVFCGADRMGVYEPETPKDDAFADQATDYVNFIVMRECDGYRQFRSAFHDGLLLGNGILKHYWDPTPEFRVEEFSGLTEDQFAMLLLKDDGKPDKNVEVLEHSTYLPGEEDEAMDEAEGA